ncbi:uncharacterized protein Fot_06405 [Forsythia ovata]|uniref:Uncharacterized protein n=1 Tax=Forsythia ovata TaxID=205694 RepID=A0ABD1WT78_9LAMI
MKLEFLEFLDKTMKFSIYSAYLNFSLTNNSVKKIWALSRIKKSQKFKKSGIPVNCLNPRNPNLLWGNYGLPIKHVSYLIPFFHKVKDFAMKSPKQNWTSVFQNFSGQETGVLQNGSFGMALMIVEQLDNIGSSTITRQ